ncbi:MAG: hypothetical protein C0601_02505 [Candidatus Muiribacterium halophilum]|uniref:peptidylprolyl isomerase n=1 Tax=Muiribacterium halophilum TaxID=2053465 RepID=A0A2N5ZKJ3_MUIH1|nr:MAG: hypothetical protein C0601_02505 [Candidatus Muirbacterium halophilum]
MFFGNKTKIIKYVIWVVVVMFIAGAAFGSSSLLYSCKMKEQKQKAEDERRRQIAEKNKIPAEDEKIVLAKFGEDSITVGDYYDYFRKLRADIKTRYKDEEQRETILDYIIEKEIVRTYAVANKISSTEKDRIDILYKLLGDKLKGVEESKVKEMLEKGYFDKDEIDYAVLEEKVKNALLETPDKIDDKTMLAFYNQHKFRYQKPEEYLVSHIFIKKDSDKREKAIEKDLDNDKIKRYYKNNMDKYHGEPSVKFRQIFISPDKFDVNISEKDLKDYFDKNKDMYVEEEQVHASHILVKTEKEATDLEKRIKNNEDFAKLAKEYSQDPGSKDKGGDLGWFKQGQMVGPFDKKVFSMKVGTISEPVKTNFGYHIIKLMDKKEKKEKTFAEVKDQIKDTLKKEKGWVEAKTKADSISTKIQSGTNFYDLVKESQSDKLDGEETGLITKGKNETSTAKRFEGELFKNGVLDSQIQKKVFDMARGEVSEPIKSAFGYHIVFLTDKEPAKPLPFEEVKDKVKTDLINWQKDIKAFNLANEAYEKLQAGKPFKDVVKFYSDGKTKDKDGQLPWFPLGVMPEDLKDKDVLTDEIASFTYFFKNGQFQAGVSIVKEIEKEIKRLKKDEYSNVIKSSFGYHIIRLDDKREGDIPAFEQVKSKIKEDMAHGVSEDDIKSYYEANVSKYTTPERVKTSHILVADEDKANEVYKKLQSGADFATVAKEMSEDYTAEKGGEFKFITKGEMPENYEDAAFTLNEGEFSKPLKTELGYYIIKVEEKQPQKTATLEEKRQEIKDELLKPVKEKNFREFIEEMKNRYGVQKYYNKFDLITKYD